ncbi:hypothetical protein MTO96_039760 [Rhipicephalus appendiculatus]
MSDPDLNLSPATLLHDADGKEISITDIAIEDAQIGKTMRANFTLTINEQLESDPTLHITITTEDGEKVGCYGSIGSCSYKMCDGTGQIEQLLGQEWDNTCPVPKMKAQESIEVPLPSFVQALIGAPPTTITISLNVTDGGSSVGCESFQVNIEDADDEHDEE